MTTCTTSIRSLLIPALEAVGSDRYAMAATIGFLTLWFKDLGWDGKTPISPDLLPPDANTAEMFELTTWWELLGIREYPGDYVLYREVLLELLEGLNHAPAY